MSDAWDVREISRACNSWLMASFYDGIWGDVYYREYEHRKELEQQIQADINGWGIN